MEPPWQAGAVGQIDHHASLIRHGGECYSQGFATASGARIQSSFFITKASARVPSGRR